MEYLAGFAIALGAMMYALIIVECLRNPEW